MYWWAKVLYLEEKDQYSAKRKALGAKARKG
jgi:hypothetical protein